MGKLVNRQKLGGHLIQLEELESLTSTSPEIGTAVYMTVIYAGRTQLIAVVCPAGNPSRSRKTMKVITKFSNHATGPIEKKILRHAKQCLPAHAVRVRWWVVEALLWVGSEPDRTALKEWVKAQVSMERSC